LACHSAPFSVQFAGISVLLRRVDKVMLNLYYYLTLSSVRAGVEAPLLGNPEQIFFL
jgi:hypothetical protein